MPPFVFRAPVRFADVDHAGIVYYPRFFDYFHVAFEELFRARLGAAAYLDLLDRRRVGFPAVRAACDYRAPLRFGDDVEVELRAVRVGGRSVTFGYRAHRVDVVAEAKGPPGGRLLCAEGEVVCAVIDLETFRAIETPDDLRQLFLELVQQPG